MSYWKLGFSNVMFVFRGVSPLRRATWVPFQNGPNFMAPKKRGPGMMLQVVGTPQPLDLFAAGTWRQPCGTRSLLERLSQPQPDINRVIAHISRGITTLYKAIYEGYFTPFITIVGANLAFLIASSVYHLWMRPMDYCIQAPPTFWWFHKDPK